MYNTPLKRIACVLDGYLEIVRSYQLNFVMDIHRDFHLACQELRLNIRRNPDSLHNLKSEAEKAYQILTRMKNITKSKSIINTDIHSLELLLKEDISIFYKNDFEALLFAQLVIARSIELANDDEQFSEFCHF